MQIDVNNDNYYAYDKPEIKSRTLRRLKRIKRAGMTEVGHGQFGYSGIMSGLYIEMVWNYSDDNFNDYMNWAEGLIRRKLNEQKVIRRISLEENIIKQQNILNAIKFLSTPEPYSKWHTKLAVRNSKKQLRRSLKNYKRLTTVISKQVDELRSNQFKA